MSTKHEFNRSPLPTPKLNILEQVNPKHNPAYDATQQVNRQKKRSQAAAKDMDCLHYDLD
jgi:hypothetical protein